MPCENSQPENHTYRRILLYGFLVRPVNTRPNSYCDVDPEAVASFRSTARSKAENPDRKGSSDHK